MFHRLGEPFRQPGIPGVIFPIEFSDTDDPFHAFLTTSVIVSGVVKDGELIIDEDELNAAIARLEADITVQRTPIADTISIADRIGTVLPSASAATAKAKKAGG